MRVLCALAQDPLVEFSQLCTADEELLSLRYHSLQEQLGREELLDALYLEFVNRTNEVGVDINLAVQQNHCSHLVQFVCGLGPRKGQALLKVLKQTNQRLENRTQLVTACHMGPKVRIRIPACFKSKTDACVALTIQKLTIRLFQFKWVCNPSKIKAAIKIISIFQTITRSRILKFASKPLKGKFWRHFGLNTNLTLIYCTLKDMIHCAI